MRVRCLNCDHAFQSDPKRTTGCLCDSDAPTWLGVTSEGRLITLSLTKYEIEKDSDGTTNYQTPDCRY